MKKFIVTALCGIVALCSIPFAACSSESSGLINLADCEIGYELPVYPDCEFDYEITRYSIIDNQYVATNYTVHVSSIKITLSSINEILPNETISGKFYRYTLNLLAYGTTDTALLGTTLYLTFYRSDMGDMVGYSSDEIDDNGNIVWNKEIGVSNYVSFSFAYLG